MRKALLTLSLLCQACLAWAGGSGLNVLVVVNQNSTNSVQLANDYCQKRGVPPQNVFRMTTWTGGRVAWLQSEFEANLRQPLLEMLRASGLTNQIHYILLSMDIPYRVVLGDSANSTTSALFYGFKTNTPTSPELPSTCSLPDFSSNSLAFTETSFDSAKPNTADTNSFLAFMLTDTSLTGAEAILDRAIAADSSFPTQSVYLEKTSDQARNVRFFSFDNALFETRVQGDSSVERITSDTTAFNGLRGLLTGFATLSLPTNAFVPGALGDSLTSFAGALFEDTGQTTLLAFLDAGTAASYGTVVEPCNYLQKFPDPLAFFYQSRGFNCAEAYYLSLLNPYQGLFVGEPLSAPFAVVAQASWPGLADGAILVGQAPIPMATFLAAGTNVPIDQVDLFIDGTFARTVTNVPPSPGNLLTIDVNGVSVPYAVTPGASVPDVAQGIANAVNLESNLTTVAAAAVGDRVEFQGLDPAVAGTNLHLSASVAGGTAAATTTLLSASRADFLDTVATGYRLLTVTNNSIEGDWLQLQIVLTNGTQVSVAVTNNSSDTNVAHLCQSLLNAVNASAALKGSNGVLGGEIYPDIHAAQFLVYARQPGWLAAQIQSTLTSSPGLAVVSAGMHPLQDNLTDLRPRNHLYVSAGLEDLSVSFDLDTASLSDGYHDLTLVAYEGTSVRTQTRVSRAVQVKNSDLFATLTPSLNGTNVDLNYPLLITVEANTNAIASIELFSTGGSVGLSTNMAAATFAVSTHSLGLGLHPFYAVITDLFGHRFRTQATSLRILPSFHLSIGGQPLSLSWNASPGLSYDVLSSADLTNSFQKVGTVTAAGNTAQWPLPVNGPSAFYRVRLGSN